MPVRGPDGGSVGPRISRDDDTAELLNEVLVRRAELRKVRENRAQFVLVKNILLLEWGVQVSHAIAQSGHVVLFSVKKFAREYRKDFFACKRLRSCKTKLKTNRNCLE